MLSSRSLLLPRFLRYQVRLLAIKKSDYKFPVINAADVDEQYVTGGGPGGQNVAKTLNCVVLKHIPTGIVVKCHETRSCEQNRKIAREKLIEALDRHLHGDNCFAAQKSREERRKLDAARSKSEKRRAMKKTFKESLHECP